MDIADSAVLARIREKLNAEGVKLWLPPLYDPETKSANAIDIKALSSRYASEFELPEDDIVDCLLLLQQNALDRLAEIDFYKETGMSTLRIKLAGFPDSHKEKGKSLNRVRISLSQMTGMDLKKQIAELIPCADNQLKLICKGRVIEENQVLDIQGVKNGAQVMVLYLAVDAEAYQSSEDCVRQLEEIKDSAKYLADQKNADANMYSLQVTDQSGKTLDLPEMERKSLAIALALHEKGRSALRFCEFSKALVFLLEADNVYSHCQSSLLERVDNYGILNLDIAWCYLSLQSISQLPAVEARLKKCEQALQRSYGSNMERVMALKGSTGSEAVLFVRLHLLQGIAAYHMGQIERAKFLIGNVEKEIKRLQISDDQLAELINMGYGPEESKIALRYTNGSLPGAVDLIIRRREEETQNRKQEQEKRRRRKIEKTLGSCRNGEPVNVRLWENLKEMGFNAIVTTAALKKTNNDINAALQLVNDMDFMIKVVMDLTGKKKSSASTSHSENKSTSAPNSNASSSSTTEPSTPTSSTSTTESFPALSPTDMNSVMNTLAQSELNLLSSLVSEDTLSSEEIARSEKAYRALSKDTCSEADYIDFSLSAEDSYLSQYKEFLHM